MRSRLTTRVAALALTAALTPACEQRSTSMSTLADGEACTESFECASKSGCLDGRCVAYTAWRQQARDRALARIEDDMLRQSGLDPRTELGATPSAPGSVVIRATTSNDANVMFAACARDERLLGGGCRSDGLTLQDSYPISPAGGDTLGGRWFCGFGPTPDGVDAQGERSAHALCSRATGVGDGGEPVMPPANP